MAPVRLGERYELTTITAAPDANKTATSATIAIATRRRFGLASAPVVAGAGAGNTVVAAVARLMFASVACGRMLVSISFDAQAEPSCAVPASLFKGDASTRVAPSTRQNFSASSVSKRLH